MEISRRTAVALWALGLALWLCGPAVAEQRDRVKIVSHRGLGWHAFYADKGKADGIKPAGENSRLAFEQALHLQRGRQPKKLELDLVAVRPTKGKLDLDRLVLIHDHEKGDMARLFGRSESNFPLLQKKRLWRRSGIKRAAELTRDEIDRLRIDHAGGDEVELSGDAARVLSFTDFMAEFGSRDKVELILDIKPHTARETLELLKEYARVNPGSLDRAGFLVWKREHTRLVQQLFPRAKLYAREGQVRRAAFSSMLLTRLAGRLARFARLELGAGGELPRRWVQTIARIGGIRPELIYALPPRYTIARWVKRWPQWLGPRVIELHTPDVLAPYRAMEAGVIAYGTKTKNEVGRAAEVQIDEVLTDLHFLPPP